MLPQAPCSTHLRNRCVSQSRKGVPRSFPGFFLFFSPPFSLFFLIVTQDKHPMHARETHAFCLTISEPHGEIESHPRANTYSALTAPVLLCMRRNKLHFIRRKARPNFAFHLLPSPSSSPWGAGNFSPFQLHDPITARELAPAIAAIPNYRQRRGDRNKGAINGRTICV